MEPKRNDDLDISFAGIRIKGAVKAIISLLNGTFAIIVLSVAVFWHDYKSGIETKAIEIALWFNVLTLATAQESRVALVKDNINRMPEVVKEKAREIK